MDSVEALRLARDAYVASTTYVDANFRKQWEDGLRMFQSKHPMDSKYNSDAYKYRSKLFRPKTRSVIRKNEAAAAAAYFSNVDVVNIEPSNEKNLKQVFGAELYKALLQYRLTKSIPWFLTLIGGLQDALTVGVVCSYQCWKYKEKHEDSKQYYLDEQTGAAIMGIDGEPLSVDQRQTKVLEDRPCIELLPVETLRIDRGSLWTDPVNSSPYLIHLMPMYVGALKEMGRPNPKTQEDGWDIPEESKILAATRESYDSTRQVREGEREDSKEHGGPVSEYEIAWVHKNIVRKNGEDFCYFTLGTEHLLSKPKPLAEMYFHGERPYVMGCAIIETHKIYPSGLPELGKEVQKEINEVTNSRMDNVRLVMNKRHIVKRGSQTDIKSLVRNVAGSVTLANNPESDIKVLDYQDVTSSSYQEQDRLNVEMDELVGNFSQGSVMTNRKLNETVGGMAMMGQGANQLTEYTIRTFTETWVEPVLQQLVKLEKFYEADDTVLQLMGQKLGSEVTDDAFDTDVELTVNVGIGATDPMMRLNKLLTAARTYAEIMSFQASGLNGEELGKEVFAAVGYRDGGRFISEGQDPRMQQAQQAMQQMQSMIQQLQAELKSKKDETMAKLQAAQMQVESKERQHEMDTLAQLAQIGAQIDLIEAQTLKTLAEASQTPSKELQARGVNARKAA